MNFKKENIKTAKNIGREKQQAVAVGEIIVPDTMPDVGAVTEVLVKPIIESVSAGEDRVNYKGRIPVSILYLSKSDKSLQNMNGNIEINDFVPVEGAKEDMICDLRYIISDCTADILNERKVSCKVLSDVEAVVKQAVEIDVINQIEDEDIPEEQQKKKTIKISNIVLHEKQNFDVKDSISIPNSKPNIEKILQCTTTVSDKTVRCHKDRVDISGELGINVLYKGEEENNPMEIAEGKLDFSGSVPFEGGENTVCKVSIDVENCRCTVAEDEDGENRVIDVEAVMNVQITADEEYSVEVLEDAYCINKKIDMEEEEIAYDLNVCNISSQYPIKEIIEIDEQSPDILRIFKVTGMPYIDDVSVEDDKITVSGVINVNIIYVTGDDENPVYSVKNSVPFSQTIEAKGAKEGMTVTIDRDISNIRFNMLSDREVEIRCVLNMETNVCKEVTGIFSVDANVTDMDKEEIRNIPSMVIYVVKEGDTLWKLSKRFNSTVDCIAEINKLENPDLIYPGQKLVIVKMPMR